MIKESTCQRRRHRRKCSIPGLWRSPGKGNGNPLQHSCLENTMARKAQWVIVCGVAKSWTQVNDWHFYFMGFPSDSDSKESACNEGDSGSVSESGRSMERITAFHSSTPVWKIHRQRSLAGCSPWGYKELVGHYWRHVQTHTHTSWFTMLCYFLVYSKVIPFYTYILLCIC